MIELKVSEKAMLGEDLKRMSLDSVQKDINAIRRLFDEFPKIMEGKSELKITGSFTDVVTGDEYDDLIFFPNAVFARNGMRYFTDGTFLLCPDLMLDALEEFVEDEFAQQD